MQFQPILREFDSRYIDGAIGAGGFYQLDVDINSVSFTHHHLFSREHVLANKLTLLYEEYLARNKRNITEFLTEKVSSDFEVSLLVVVIDGECFFSEAFLTVGP